MDYYSSDGSWFLIITLIIVILIAGLAAANIYYWNKIRQEESVSKDVGLTLLVLNSIAAAGLVIVFLWAIYRLIQNSTKPMHYPGMGTAPVMTMSSPMYGVPSPHYM